MMTRWVSYFNSTKSSSTTQQQSEHNSRHPRQSMVLSGTKRIMNTEAETDCSNEALLQSAKLEDQPGFPCEGKEEEIERLSSTLARCQSKRKKKDHRLVFNLVVSTLLSTIFVLAYCYDRCSDLDHSTYDTSVDTESINKGTVLTSSLLLQEHVTTLGSSFMRNIIHSFNEDDIDEFAGNDDSSSKGRNFETMNGNDDHEDHDTRDGSDHQTIVTVILDEYKNGQNCHGSIISTQTFNVTTKSGSKCKHTSKMKNNSVKNQFCNVTTQTLHQTVYIESKKCKTTWENKAISPMHLKYTNHTCTYSHKLRSCTIV